MLNNISYNTDKFENFSNFNNVFGKYSFSLKNKSNVIVPLLIEGIITRNIINYLDIKEYIEKNTPTNKIHTMFSTNGINIDSDIIKDLQNIIFYFYEESCGTHILDNLLEKENENHECFDKILIELNKKILKLGIPNTIINSVALVKFNIISNKFIRIYNSPLDFNQLHKEMSGQDLISKIMNSNKSITDTLTKTLTDDSIITKLLTKPKEYCYTSIILNIICIILIIFIKIIIIPSYILNLTSTLFSKSTYIYSLIKECKKNKLELNE